MGWDIDFFILDLKLEMLTGGERLPQFMIFDYEFIRRIL